MGKLYWVTGRDGKEDQSCAAGVYRDLLERKENVIFLSAEEIRQAHRDAFDGEATEEAWKQSAQRDMMMIRYLVGQDIDVVYCSSREFREVRDWAGIHIPDTEFVAGEKDGLSSDAATLPKRSPGTMYWVTGLSGAGKTTIGTLLCQKMRRCKKNVLLIDGDMFRDAMGTQPDYSRKAREELSYRNIRLGKLLVEKGLDIVWCTICMFRGVREWNRQNIGNYVEVYLEVPVQVLEMRREELYRGAREGRVENVVGINQEAEYPEHPDLVVRNDGRTPPEDIASMLWESLREWRKITDAGELEELLPRLGKQIAFSLYTYIDLMQYGLEDGNMDLYSVPGEKGDGTAVLALRYHNGLNLVALENSYDIRKVCRLVEHLRPSIISARLDIVDALHGSVAGEYGMDRGHVMEWEGTAQEHGEDEVEVAGPGDCREIASLILGEDSIGSYYELEDMTSQLSQRMREGMGRNYVLRRGGRIVAHSGTYGEYGDIAVIGGVVTDPKHRNQGLFRRVFLSLAGDLAREGKRVYLFVFGDPLRRMYEKLGMRTVGEWGRLVRGGA